MGPVGGVLSGAQAVQLREVSLSQLAALLSTVGAKTCVYMMTTITRNFIGGGEMKKF